MASLSFDAGKDSRPIAIVRGGDMDGDILYLHESHGKPGHRGRREIPVHKYQGVLKKLAPKKADHAALVAKLQEALDDNAEIPETEPEEVRDLFKRIKGDMSVQSEVELPHDSMFHLIPNPDPRKRDVYYIAGASGSGKSHIARGIAEGYRRLFPDREVYLVSKLLQDDTLDNMKGGKPKRINIQTLVEDPPDIEEFRDCMVIIDDVDALEKPQLKAVMTLANDLAITGRHTCSSLLWLSHYLTNYSATRLLLNEATCYVIYPQTTSRHALKYLLETHAGMDADVIKSLRKMGRWVAIHKNMPPYLITSHAAKLLNQE
jgi:hypothetical protein